MKLKVRLMASTLSSSSTHPQAIINFQSMFDSIDLPLLLLPLPSVHVFFTANSIYNNDIGCDTFSPSERTFVFSAVKKTIKNSFFTLATYSTARKSSKKSEKNLFNMLEINKL